MCCTRLHCSKPNPDFEPDSTPTTACATALFVDGGGLVREKLAQVSVSMAEGSPASVSITLRTLLSSSGVARAPHTPHVKKSYMYSMRATRFPDFPISRDRISRFPISRFQGMSRTRLASASALATASPARLLRVCAPAHASTAHSGRAQHACARLAGDAHALTRQHRRLHVKSWM